MKLKEIQRTSTFAWAPYSTTPVLATGTVAGALDASFTNDSQLEIWNLDFMQTDEGSVGGDSQKGPSASVTTHSRFNRIVWGVGDGTRPKGVIAAGMENGELNLWDPEKIIASAEPAQSLIFKNTQHTGPVRALDFNPIQNHLLSSGGSNGEIYIWDLKNPGTPYTPGTRSTKLDEVTAMAWNNQVPHVLGTSSSSGYTVVWDLRGKREVTALQYGGGAGTTGGSSVHQGGGVLALGSRRGMSAIAWHPDNATRVITASEDDNSPIIMVWDLRNSRAPEKILTGHEKGVLSLSWCKQDPDLLLSCGKDNRVLVWNPQTSEVIGEIPAADNWAFQVEWSPRNPDCFATAFFDGTIGIHSIQSTNEAQNVHEQKATNGADIFDSASFPSSSSRPPLSLKQPPKWLRRSSSGTFGFGGKLVTVSNLASAQGANQSRVVHLRTIVTEPDIVERVDKLREATETQSLEAFAQRKSSEADANQADTNEAASWKALLSLFNAGNKEELIQLLGFSKEATAKQVADTVKNYKRRSRVAAATSSSGPQDEAATSSEVPRPPYVSFAEPEKEDTIGQEGYAASEGPTSVGGLEATPSEVSASAISDFTKATEPESTATEPSLFGDDAAIGTPQIDAGADFFSSVGTLRSAIPERVLVPHHSYAADSSVAATVGSRASSPASEPTKAVNFKIYPTEESGIDRLITKSIVLGDFESAVSLCLAADRFADAILLAARGGLALLQKAQTAYFERNTVSLPYLRLFQSVATNDLADIVQNAELSEWKEIFVVLCTFAKAEEFAGLAQQLGQRLEFQGQLLKSASESTDASAAAAREYRQDATLCYLVAGKLDKLVDIWVAELAEEEANASDDSESTSSRYATHAKALQSFIEKVTVFRAATKYVDSDLEPVSHAESPRTYRLGELYSRYYEYADLLANQGFVQEAVKYIKLAPADYDGPAGLDSNFKIVRDLLKGATTKETVLPLKSHPTSAAPVPAPKTTGYGYAAPTQPAYGAPNAPSYGTYPNGGLVHQGAGGYAPPAPSQSYGPSSSHYGPPSGAPGYGAQRVAPPSVPPPPPAGIIPPPPPLANASPSSSLPPPPPKRDPGGWNDAPAIDTIRKTSGTPAGARPAITSPFPNSPAPMSGPASPTTGSPVPPPPPKGGPPLRGQTPPLGPPQRGPAAQGLAPPPPGPPSGGPPSAPYPPQGRAPSYGAPVRPGSAGPGQPYPARVMSPLNPAVNSQPRPTGPPGPPGAAGLPGPPQQRAPVAPPPNAYGPPPGHTQPQYQQPPPGPQGPPPPGAPGYGPSGGRGASAQQQQAPPPPRGPPSSSSQLTTPRNDLREAPSSPPTPPAKPAAPATPKFPPGDRSHIPESDRFIFEVLAGEMNRVKQTSPPAQKRMIDDTERRLNVLFDALNAGTISRPVVDELGVLVQCVQVRDLQQAAAIHMDLLTTGSRTDDIGLWMSGLKQLLRLI